MTWKKMHLKPIKLALTISFAWLGLTPVQAQPVNPVILVQRPPVPAGTYVRGNLTFEQPFEQPPVGQGAPRGTKPGGSRGCSLAVQKPLTALVPVTKEADGRQLPWGLTTQDYPTFWFYVPYETEAIRAVKFSLRNRAKQTVYETPVTLTKTPGVISVSLSPTAPPLEINNWYQSYLFIDISCNPNTSLEKDFAQGWVRREAPTLVLKHELDAATTPRQRAVVSARHGIWYEALTTLAELSCTDSKDNDWTKLLRSAGLEAIAKEPIVNCRTPKN